MTTLTPRVRAVNKHLARLYALTGMKAELIQTNLTTTPVTVIMRVHEMEEGVDGTVIEAVIKGYAAQIRTVEIEGLTGPFMGGRIELADDKTFDGHNAFYMDAEPFTHGREGAQRLIKLSAAPDLDEDGEPEGGWA